MRIGVIGPVWQSIPPSGYGGSEIVVYNLVEGLVDRGHEVTLFAAGGAKTRARLVAVVDRPVLEIKGRFDFSDPSYDLLNAAEAFKLSSDFDVLHNVLGYQLLPFTPFARCPVVHTSHSSVVEYVALVNHFKQENYISISDAQRKLHPDANYLATVYHGIDIDKYIPGQNKEDWLLFIGRIMPEKGVHLAVEAAKESKNKLIIAGIVDDRDKKYFSEQLAPQIDGKQIVYFGQANEEQKIDLMQRAKAHLFPTQWDEAFGLVMIEAMACGTPTIGWKKGAVDEVLREGVTGYVVNSVKEMAAAIMKAERLKQQNCRAEAVRRFSRATMAMGYEVVYNSLVGLKESDEDSGNI